MKTTEKMMVHVPTPVSYEAFENAIVSALEGGSNYWYLLNVSSADKEFEDVPKEDDFRYLSIKIAWKLYHDPNFKLIVYDLENEDRVLGIVNQFRCQLAIMKMSEEYPLHYEDFINDRGDADTGDVFFQLATMGDLVFG